MQSDRWKQIQGLFEAAQQHPADERHAFLQDACPDDPELCSEVVKLLRAAETDDSFLDSPMFPSATAQPLLKKGDKVGVFEIQELIGRGGMGEVYRARDLRLKRDVALKVIPAILTTDAERLRRFEQEARAASLLNHPNILAIYDIGTHNGVPYIVSELLEGQTLRSCLAHGPIPFSKALDYAQHMADGLAAAHQKGIVHRDLKPENVFLTKDGRIKILDFGLAKLDRARLPGPSSGTIIPSDSTEPGMILGTVGYMSPEQVQGRPADARSDIFALGLILHELLTGQRAFRGASAAETMSAILREDPPQVSDLNPKLPKGVSLVVRHCLEKRQEDRFESARDLAFALKAASDPEALAYGKVQTAGPGILGIDATPRWRLSGKLLAASTAIAILAVISLSILYWRQKQIAAAIVTFEIEPPAGQRIRDCRMSPDGKRAALIMSTPSGKERKLWIRPLESPDLRLVPGTEEIGNLCWSPDGRRIAFTQTGQIRTIELDSGTIRTVCEANQAKVWDWSATNTLLFSKADAGESVRLYSVLAGGGSPNAIIPLDPTRKEKTQTDAQFLPDGKRFLYRSRGGIDSGIYVASLDGSSRSPMSKGLGADYMRYAKHPRTGKSYLLYCDITSCLTQEVDPAAARLVGEPKALELRPQDNDPSAVPSALAYLSQSRLARSKLAWFNRDGKELEVVSEFATIMSHEISLDDRHVAWELLSPPHGRGDIWVTDLVRKASLRLTDDDGWELTQRFWPDASKIAFIWLRDHPRRFGFAIKPANGSGTAELIHESPFYYSLDDVSPDGRSLLCFRVGPPHTLWILPVTGDRQPVLYLRTQGNNVDGRFSPDGRWIAYTSSDSGRMEVHVRDFAAEGAAASHPRSSLTVVSPGGGRYPRWSRDGKELFYRASDGFLMAVPVKLGNQFTAGRPEKLFQLPGAPGAYYRSPYAVSSDARRFLVAVPESADTGQRLIVTTNWMESLGLE